MQARATVPAVGFVLPQRRCLALIAQLREAGRTQGEIGELLDVSQQAVKQYIDGANGPGIAAIWGAVERLKLQPGYFFDPSLGDDPPWESYVGNAPPLAANDSPGWKTFVLEYLDGFIGRGLRAENISTLRALTFKGGPPKHPGPYVDFAEILVTGGATDAPRPPGATEAKAQQEKHGGKIRRRKR